MFDAPAVYVLVADAMAPHRTPRMGRPRKPRALISRSMVNFRLTDMQRYQLETSIAPLTVSAWLRAQVLAHVKRAYRGRP